MSHIFILFIIFLKDSNIFSPINFSLEINQFTLISQQSSTSKIKFRRENVKLSILYPSNFFHGLFFGAHFGNQNFFTPLNYI
jgi:hypothetical protein